VGFFSTAFAATGNTTLQLTADPQFRGRVMALWSVTFTGSTPIGGPIVGVVADGFGPRYGLGLGAIACLAAAIIGTLAVRRVPPADRYARRPRELNWPAYQQAHETRVTALVGRSSTTSGAPTAAHGKLLIRAEPKFSPIQA
jgi:MFS family permease